MTYAAKSALTLLIVASAIKGVIEEYRDTPATRHTYIATGFFITCVLLTVAAVWMV